MILINSLNKKISELPMLPSLYMLLKVWFEVCSLSNYTETDFHCKEYILTTVKDIIKKMQAFQDALLSSCIEVCLAVPVTVVYSDQNNLNVFEPVILQALSLGLSHLPLAHTIISMLGT